MLIAKVAALAQVAERHDLAGVAGCSRPWRAGLVALLVVVFPYVAPEGLGRAFNGEAGPRVQVAAATGDRGRRRSGGRGRAGPAGVLGSAAVVLLFAFWLHRRLGGLTGDVYGAAIELGEVAMLVLCTVGEA